MNNFARTIKELQEASEKLDGLNESIETISRKLKQLKYKSPQGMFGSLDYENNLVLVWKGGGDREPIAWPSCVPESIRNLAISRLEELLAFETKRRDELLAKYKQIDATSK